MIKKIKDFIINNFMTLYIVYFCTLFIDITSLLIDYPAIETIVKVARYLVYVLFVTRLILLLPEYKKLVCETKWKEKTKLTKFIYIIFGIMILSLLICAATTPNRRTLFVIFVLLTAYNTDYKKIFKTTMTLQIVLTSMVVLLSVLGITQDFLVARGEIQRHSLGFIYTTNIVQMFMFSSILYLFNIGSKITYRELFAIQLTNALIYALTNTRAEFAIMEIIIILVAIIKILKKYNKERIIEKTKKIYSKIILYTFPLYPIISFTMVMCYKFGGIWNDLNIILSNRLKQTYDCIVSYRNTSIWTKDRIYRFRFKRENKVWRLHK